MTSPGVLSAPASSFAALRPRAPSSLTPQEYTRPPSTMAIVCIPPHATLSTGREDGMV